MLDLKLTIGEIATLLGITPKTIRHYHNIGLLDQPERDANNYRIYSMVHIEQLQHILQLKRFGLSLEQIKIIVQSQSPHELTKRVLQEHVNHLQDEIDQLQKALDHTQSFLNHDSLGSSDSGIAFQPPHDAIVTIEDTVRPYASEVCDILIEVERLIIPKIDSLKWQGDYALFWHLVSKHFIQSLRDESDFILWMERYLALANMETDDLQGRAWLNELQNSASRKMLSQSLQVPSMNVLGTDEEERIQKLLPLFLYEEGAPLQKQFIKILLYG